MAAEGEPTKPIRLFSSYSHQDEELRRNLQEHLAVLKWNGMIAEWNDRDIEAGADWETEIDRHLSAADIILLLISASFLALPYCWSVEVKKALERHARGEARVIPVLLRPCRWQRIPFARLQVTPKDAKPVTLWPDPDAVSMIRAATFSSRSLSVVNSALARGCMPGMVLRRVSISQSAAVCRISRTWLATGAVGGERGFVQFDQVFGLAAGAVEALGKPFRRADTGW